MSDASPTEVGMNQARERLEERKRERGEPSIRRCFRAEESFENRTASGEPIAIGEIREELDNARRCILEYRNSPLFEEVVNTYHSMSIFYGAVCVGLGRIVVKEAQS